MPNDSYIRARDGVHYNRTVAEAAEAVAEEIEHPEIKAWATSVGKQHRFHEQRFQGTLDRLDKKQDESSEESAVETPGEESIADQQAAFAAEQEAQDQEPFPEIPQVQMVAP